jgi:hypothetical protein
MIRTKISSSVGALGAAVVCLAILFGMIVGHAWPLWFGRTVVLPAVSGGTATSARGDYVRVATPATTLVVRPGASAAPNQAIVRPVAPWWDPLSGMPPGDRNRRVRFATIYVQLERADNGEYRPVTVSRKPVQGAVNLRGLVTMAQGPDVLRVEYGLDAFYMQQGGPRAIAEAFRNKQHVQLEVAIASSGHARIRNLLVDGTAVGK